MNKAFIFDMDGVITRTEKMQSAAESKVFATIGIKITPQEILNSYNGWKDIEIFRDMASRNNIKEPVEKLREEKWKIVYNEVSQKGIPVVPGVLDLIEKLRQEGYILAIASSTTQKFLNTVLTTLHIKDKFNVIVSGDQVKLGKPNPEIFLLAAKKINISPDACIVIEDAPSGVSAAKAAGMKCIAITTGSSKEKLKKADLIIDSFYELSAEVIKNLSRTFV